MEWAELAVADTCPAPRRDSGIDFDVCHLDMATCVTSTILTSSDCAPTVFLCKVSPSNSIHGLHSHNVFGGRFELL